MLSKYLSVFFFILFSVQLFAQDKCPVRFGHVTENDFDISKLNVDTTSGAVILADVGLTTLDGLELVFQEHRRVRIINKNGFDLATVTVPLYATSFQEERLMNVKASTYNLENDKITETKFNSSEIFDDEKDKNHIYKKFTLPSIKEGCIIEYNYTVRSAFLFNFRPWVFQGKYPTVWSEYEADIPDFLDYTIISQGYQPFYLNTESFSIRPYNNISANTDCKRWVIKDVPALKEEPYITSLRNHIDKIEFQLKGVDFPGQFYKDIIGTWSKAGEDLLKDEDFGDCLNRNNGWMDQDIKMITAGVSDNLGKAKRIYYYVRNNFKSTGIRSIWLSQSIKDVFKNKSGSDADINMLLTTMLRHEHLDADPLILSTRDNGYPPPISPLINKFNYLIGKLTIDSADYFLDATKSYLGFGRLPEYCYNGPGRTITDTPSLFFFSPDTLQQNETKIVTLFNDSIVQGKWIGNFNSNMNYYESCDLREKIINKGRNAYEKELHSSFPEGISISGIQITNLDSCEESLQINCGLTVEGDKNDSLIYFNPMIKDDYSKNPFKSAERKYPVEMPYPIDEMYTLTLEVPKGYEINELPKSAKVTFNDTDGLFEYLISNDGDSISLRSNIKFAKTTFMPDEYHDLREFFDYVVKMRNQLIVFKKKNNL